MYEISKAFGKIKQNSRDILEFFHNISNVVKHVEFLIIV